MPRYNLGRRRFGFQRIVDRAPTRAVERFGPEASSDLPIADVWRRVRGLYREGLNPAIALHVRHRGEVVLDRTIGHVWNPPGGEKGPVATPDTLFNLFSASKIVTATLVMALVDDGKLDLEAPVVTWLPEFGKHGKEGILLRHLLQHTAGIPNMPHVPDVEAMLRTGRLDLDLLYDLKPLTPPGRDVAYHPMTSWFLIQEIVERVTGLPLKVALHQRLLQPLGFQHLSYGVDPTDLDKVARHAVTGPPVPGFMSSIFTDSVGVDFEQAVRLTNDPSFLTAVLPSANVIGTPREVGRFMQMLLNRGELDGVRVLSRAAARRIPADVSPLQFDSTLRFPMRYGLGVMMGGNAFSLYGLGTRGAFGHLGLSTVVVFADPARDLAVAFITTGKPMMAPGMFRWYGVLQFLANVVPRG